MLPHSNSAAGSLPVPLPVVSSAAAQSKRRRKGQKCMSRRSGQSGNLVQQGKWWRVRFRLDDLSRPTLQFRPSQPRTHRCNLDAHLCSLVSPRLVQAAGANSEERFNEVVLGEATFREQAKAYLRAAVSRNRKPLRDTVSIEGAMRKWIYPAIRRSAIAAPGQSQRQAAGREDVCPRPQAEDG
jgi:hypothetical protein